MAQGTRSGGGEPLIHPIVRTSEVLTMLRGLYLLLSLGLMSNAVTAANVTYGG